MEENTMRTFSKDPLAHKLQSIAHTILVIVFGLSPLIFLPFVPIAPGATKILFLILGMALALVFFSLSVLRSGKLSYSKSYTLWALWGVALVALISAFLSGDIADALVGTILESHTALFVALLALSTTLWTVVDVRKDSIMRLYMLVVASTFILLLFHFTRIVFGADFLSLGIFVSETSSPIGSWNDLALFLGLIILVGLVTLEQLPLTQRGRIVFGLVVAASLIMLMIVNFFFVWVVLGLVSLILVVYSHGKNRFVQLSETQSMEEEKPNTSALSVSVPIIVFLVSVLFMFAGGPIGGFISEKTGISYLEVRPSFQATADIARGVYADNALLGVGPNRFADAWRMYKDSSIGSTIFWNVDFQSGSGYIPTFFVTTGALGGIVWLVFIVMFAVSGMRTLLYAQGQDKMWYFICTSSFVGALYIWGMTFLYMPNVSILILGALFTGVTILAQSMLQPQRIRTLVVGPNRRSGFILTFAVMIVIVIAVGSMYNIGRRYFSVYLFADSAQVSEGTTLEEIEQQLVQAFDVSPNDIYARRLAEYQLARMQVFAGQQDLTELQQQQFQTAIANGVNAGQLAIERDETDPQNWAILGRIYGLLASLEVEGAFDRAETHFNQARVLDPKNPLRPLELAQLSGQTGDLEAARTLVEEAIGLKSNYSDAFYLLSQIDVAEGDVESAVAATRAIISFEPQNATRYYQLGLLEISRQGWTNAAQAFAEAVRLNSDYSNARYFLALMYSQLGDTENALVQMKEVLARNPENELVLSHIAELESKGRISSVDFGGGQAVQGETSVTQDDSSVTTDTAPETPLITPVNTPASSSSEGDE